MLSGNDRGCYWTIIVSIKESGKFRKKGAIQFQCVEDRNYQSERAKKYYLANREHILKQTKEYKKSKKGKEAEKRAVKKYRNTEKGKRAISKALSIYFKTKKGKKAQHQVGAKRRNLGFIELNREFEGSEAHHIDKEFVLYIPKELHNSIWHNVWSGQGMEEINLLAFEFVYEVDYIKMGGGKVKTNY